MYCLALNFLPLVLWNLKIAMKKKSMKCFLYFKKLKITKFLT